MGEWGATMLHNLDCQRSHVDPMARGLGAHPIAPNPKGVHLFPRDGPHFALHYGLHLPPGSQCAPHY